MHTTMRVRRLARMWLVVVSAAGLALAGCESTFNHPGEADAGDGSDAYAQFAGAGLNQTCAASGDCRLGLACVSGKCVTVGKSAENDACLLSAECGPGLQCGWAGFCVKAGGGISTEACLTKDGTKIHPDGTPCNDGSIGSACTSSSSCQAGLYCNLLSLSGVCAAHAATAQDLGGACKSTEDCLDGLTCSPARKICVPGSLTLNPDLFPGVECDDEGEDALPFQAIAEIPQDVTLVDFYKLPFPNDLWKKNGHMDVAKHVTPGPGFVGFDAVQGVKDGLAQEMTGFGLTTAMYLRFSRPLDPTSLSTQGPGASVRLIDLTTGDQVEPLTAHFHGARNKFICRNWLYVHTAWSKLLTPGHTYALLVSDAVKGDPKLVTGATTPVLAPYLKMLASDTAPTDVTQKPAWDVYAPLRQWLKGPGQATASHLFAFTQFTTWEPRKWTQDLAAAANSALAPSIKDNAWTLCDGKTKSPCADPDWKGPGSDPRDCPATPSTAFREYHARIVLPMWQDGVAPYKSAGGNLRIGPDGKPQPADFKPVCMAVTIPTGIAKPAGGWPLIVMAHGTGGNMRSMASSFGAIVSNVNNTGLGFATIGIDQPMHFDRRGVGVTTDPGPLFYNFANPQAARGNFYQGAADNYTLFRWAKTFQGTLPGNVDVSFDKTKFVYFGHSQGSTTGPMFLPYQTDPPLAAAILSGCGGSLPYGLLGKKKPYDASVGLRIGLQEMNLDVEHPALNLLQWYFEASDPLLYAPQHVAAPAKPSTGMHVLHTYGHGDSYTPPDTSRIFAGALGSVAAQDVTPAPSWFDTMVDLGVQVVTTFPISANVNGKTAVTLQALNDPANSLDGTAYDGHFVLFRDKTLGAQAVGFLQSLLQTGTPVVIQ